ncbi:hypothetical protein LXL04_010313 [Taraxacum kok-saghyz]
MGTKVNEFAISRGLEGKNMDRETWMYGVDRASNVFLNNLKVFLDVAKDHRVCKGVSYIWCPCKLCQNCIKFDKWSVIQ